MSSHRAATAAPPTSASALVRHVRAQRRRAVHLLRQRGVHEHRRAALERDAAGGAYRDDPGSGSAPAMFLAPARTFHASRWRTHSVRRDRERFNLRDLERKVKYAMRFTAHATSTSSCHAPWAGVRRPRTRSRSRAWQSRPAFFRCSKRRTAQSRRVTDSAQGPRDRIPEVTEALCASVPQSAGPRTH